MVRVRLKRTGARNAACFRVVVMDQRSSRDGKAIEELGFYDPISKQEKGNVERVRAGKSLKDRVRKPVASKKAKAKAAAEAEAKAKAAEEAKAAAEAAAKAAEEAKAAEAAAPAAEAPQA